MSNHMQKLNENLRPLLDAVDAMRKDGIEKDIELPQIAVMGDQSSGKSSALESISGISFPRGAGLVTRCVTQITMRFGKQWQAKVRAGLEECTLHEDDKNKIGDLILEFTEKLCDGRNFCGLEERIEIELTAPDVPNVTLIDLPGIVRNADDRVRDQVDAILQNYLEQSRTVILAVIPCNVDIETVDILERAKRADPKGERTVGVLTMPDLVNPGSECNVLKVFANEKHHLRHEYYMLKNRTQKELDENADVDQLGLDWFQQSEYAAHSARFGARALGDALSNISANLAWASLPGMRREIQEKERETNDVLMGMGQDPPVDVGSCRQIALRYARAVAMDISQDEKRFLYENMACKQFSRDIQKTKPGFEGEHDVFTVEFMSRGLWDGVWYDAGQELAGMRWKTPRSTTRIGVIWPEENGATKVVKMEQYFRDDIARKMEEGRRGEIAGFLSYPVFVSIVHGYIADWKPLAEKYMHEMSDSMLKVSNDVFANAHMPEALAGMLKAEVQAHVKLCDKRAHEDLERLLSNEKDPSTENHYFQDNVQRRRNARQAAKFADSPSTMDKKAVLAILKGDAGGESNEAQEVGEMIDILAAYWKVATKRYIDNVKQALRECYTTRHLEQFFADVLMGQSDHVMLCLFGEEESQTRRRADLRESLARLKRGRGNLERLHTA